MVEWFSLKTFLLSNCTLEISFCRRRAVGGTEFHGPLPGPKFLSHCRQLFLELNNVGGHTVRINGSAGKAVPILPALLGSAGSRAVYCFSFQVFPGVLVFLQRAYTPKSPRVPIFGTLTP